MEKISIKKAVTGIVEPRNYIKAGVFSMNIGVMIVFILGAVTIFNFFFGSKKVQTQNQSSSFTIDSGAVVENLTVVSNQEQDGNDKIIGLEGALSSEDLEISLVKYLNDNLAVGVGARYRFDPYGDQSEVVPSIKVRWEFF